MTELENKIFEVVKSSGGISGAGIAAVLGEEKETINTVLFSSIALATQIKQKPDLKWYVAEAGKAKAEAAESQMPDEDLKKLCNYYLQCITLESSNSFSLFLSDKNQYRVLNSLSMDSPDDKAAITFLNKVSEDKKKKTYVGYPTRIYSVHGKDGKWHKKMAPVFLFPVEYKQGGSLDISWVPSVNMEVLKRYCGMSSDTLATSLVDLQSELGMNDPNLFIEVDDLVLRLVKIRQWEWAEPIDPYHIPKAMDLISFKDGIFNRPVIISAEKPNFTIGLEAELMALSLLSEQKYQGTALHAWIKNQSIPKLTNPATKQLLEVLPLNTEQTKAVETSLNSELTIVTGPPGTGKSQVVTDLLTNIAWNGKSALFSSRNNKAVDVVEKRVNGLSKRPSLLRVGSDQHDTVLADIIEGLLNSPAAPADQIDLNLLQQQYDAFCGREEELKTKKLELVQQRNLLDEKERVYCDVRDLIGDHLYTVNESDAGTVLDIAKAYIRAVERSKKENNGFFARLFWSQVKQARITDLEAAEKAYNEMAIRYDLVRPCDDRSEDRLKKLEQAAAAYDKAISIALDYRNTLNNLHSESTLEQIDRELADLKEKRADLAQEIWDKWLRTNNLELSHRERQEMSSFVTATKLGAPINPAVVTKMVDLAKRYIPCWAVTSLSAKKRIPFEAGVYDYVIIDEASQCDIASIIPLLFRAKRAVIIGDPMQLPHISSLAPKQDRALLDKLNVDYLWSYSVNSLYHLASTKAQPTQIVQLRDHFRSCADIIEFSNETFYDGSLRTATKYDTLKPPAEEKPGIRWIQVKGKTIRPASGSAYNDEEVAKVIGELKRLIDVGYGGSIGVTTPFREQAGKIRKALEKEPKLKSELEKNHEFLADTVHKFQGDERDLMIFSNVVTSSASPGTVSFLQKTGNLFNVAITRARSTLVVIGDYHYCANCDEIPYLQKFAKYCYNLAKGTTAKPMFPEVGDSPAYPFVPNPAQVSDWERKFYTALFNAGIKTAPQYPVEQYRLDLAIFLPNGRKLDIEVDGEMYHRSWNGELCYRDQLRNQRMFELGWDVRRFWVYQIRDDLDWCVEQVRDWQQKN